MKYETTKEGAIIAYETTQCLTEGIRCVLLLEDNPRHGQTVSWEKKEYGNYIRSGRIGGTVFLTFSDACKEAERFKQQRIKKPKEQIEKLEMLSFNGEKNE